MHCIDKNNDKDKICHNKNILFKFYNLFYKERMPKETNYLGNSGNYSFKKNSSINVFIEFEFFVPKNDRKNIRLKANPYKKDHFLIGGTFIRTYPL